MISSSDFMDYNKKTIVFVLFLFLFLFIIFFVFPTQKRDVSVKEFTYFNESLETSLDEDLNDLNELIEEVEVPEAGINEGFFDANVATIYFDENASRYDALTSAYLAVISIDSQEANITTLSFDVRFDSSKLAFINASIGFDARILGKLLTFDKISDDKIHLNLSTASSKRNAVFAKGKLATITFIIKEKGSSFIDFENVKAFDSEGTEVKVEGLNAIISLT